MKCGRISISVEPWGYVALALLVLILPAQWLIAVLMSAAFHEFLHFAALFICKARVCGLRIGTGGAQIVTGPLEAWKELFCVLAGPLGGLSLILLGEYFPRVAICAALHSVYNLLPIYPLDGGRAMKCIAQMLFPVRYANKITFWVQAIVMVMICILCVYAAFLLRMGVIPFIFAFMLIRRAGVIKIPCKRA